MFLQLPCDLFPVMYYWAILRYTIALSYISGRPTALSVFWMTHIYNFTAYLHCTVKYEQKHTTLIRFSRTKSSVPTEARPSLPFLPRIFLCAHWKERRKDHISTTVAQADCRDGHLNRTLLLKPQGSLVNSSGCPGDP